MARSIFIHAPEAAHSHAVTGHRSLLPVHGGPALPTTPSPVPSYLGPLSPGATSDWFVSPTWYSSVRAGLTNPLVSGSLTVELPDSADVEIQAGQASSPMFGLATGHRMRLRYDGQAAPEDAVQVYFVMAFPFPMFILLVNARLL